MTKTLFLKVEIKQKNLVIKDDERFVSTFKRCSKIGYKRERA
ncbi:MAG: hypothetical protein OEY22_05785 [Candidatus Bathyarchaeota archaeon]|nr:hypothetical protein [Candidatus Bathyarchaeota archaeon]MDH5786996.1 hypothetical protein [Candidatus Bathyarchaeota archaeon]